jgi:phosphohistidine phosphatase
MKTLYIVRHGKSTWDYDGVKDSDRPLKEKGISDAMIMAERLKNSSRIPDQIISSSAARALHTAIIFNRSLKIPEKNFKIDSDLYAATVDEILDVIYGVDDSVNSLMIFGHNPGFTELANYLCNLKIDNIPTSGIVMITFTTEKWIKLNRNVVMNEFFDFPGNEPNS